MKYCTVHKLFYPIQCNECAQASSTFSIGQHGYKKKEQNHLGNKYKIKITGANPKTPNEFRFESEHVIGFDVLKSNIADKRGSNTALRALENKAPAYQEIYNNHRTHIGTGTKNAADQSGMNSSMYRASQRTAMEEEMPSNAVQLNVMGYSQQKNFFNTNDGKIFNTFKMKGWNDSDIYKQLGFSNGITEILQSFTPEQKASIESYIRMIMCTDEVGYLSNSYAVKTTKFTNKLEMIKAKFIEYTHIYDTNNKMFDEFLKAFGLPASYDIYWIDK